MALWHAKDGHIYRPIRQVDYLHAMVGVLLDLCKRLHIEKCKGARGGCSSCIDIAVAEHNYRAQP